MDRNTGLSPAGPVPHVAPKQPGRRPVLLLLTRPGRARGRPGTGSCRAGNRTPTHHLQRGRTRRTRFGQAAESPAVDRRPGTPPAGGRAEAEPRDGLDTGPTRPLPGRVRGGASVRPFPPHRLPRAASRRSSRPELDGRRKQQLAERLARGEAWADTDKVFTREDGSWLHPETVSDTFRRIVQKADLPPINLRDLRHGTAALAHADGGDLHAIKETLRHSTITLTSDTYTSLLPEIDMEIAEKAAALVPRARRNLD
nr:tyrosine-type recombinase/integrase [Streptomyces sp. VRA16 Mangrove soil]